MQVVKVNGVEIPQSLIGQEMQYHPAETAEIAWAKAAQALVVKELLLQRSAELGIVAQAQEHETEEEARIRELIAQEVALPSADEATCEQYFEANRPRFRSPDLVEASHILIAADPNDFEAREKAEALAIKLTAEVQANPEQFTALARQYSECPSKEVGGNLGQITKGNTVPEFERVIMRLPEGIAERPVESRYGYHVVKIERRIEGRPLPYDQVRDKIMAYLGSQVYQRAVSQYLRLLAGEANIEGIAMEAEGSPLVQ